MSISASSWSTFNGANAGENIEILAHGRGATLTRDIGVVTMNLTNLETIDANAHKILT